MKMRDQIPDEAIRKFCKAWDHLLTHPRRNDPIRVLTTWEPVKKSPDIGPKSRRAISTYVAASRESLIRKYARIWA